MSTNDPLDRQRIEEHSTGEWDADEFAVPPATAKEPEEGADDNRRITAFLSPRISLGSPLRLRVTRMETDWEDSDDART